MGLLASRGANTHVLYSRTLIGRSPLAQLRIQDRRVSSEHAVLWYDDGWWLKDLGSRNGTWIGERRLAPNVGEKVAIGDELHFGGPSVTWTLQDDSAPGAVAICSSTGVRIAAEEDLLLVPNAEDPQLAAYPDGMGAWLIEQGDQIITAREVTDVAVDGVAWTLVLPFETAKTWGDRSEPGAAPGLVFRVSSDEEHVEITVRRGAVTKVLEARTHAYFLLTLARQRLQDAELSPPERGWLHAEDVCRMLRFGRATLNQRVFRARQQLAGTGLVPAAQVLERRPHTGQLRLGIADLTVEAL
jgi:hypothetical protein